MEQGPHPDPRAEVVRARARIDLTLLEEASRLDAEAQYDGPVPKSEDASV